MQEKYLSCRASVTIMGLREYFSADCGSEKFVFISQRIKGEGGRTFGFYIRGLTERQLREIKADSEKDFVFEVICKGVLEPKLNISLCENLFLAGEAFRLFEKIIFAGGVGKTFGELKREVGVMLLKGESEAVYGCLAAFEMGITPKEFAFMDLREKACIGAFIDEKIRIKQRRGRLR